MSLSDALKRCAAKAGQTVPSKSEVEMFAELYTSASKSVPEPRAIPRFYNKLPSDDNVLCQKLREDSRVRFLQRRSAELLNFNDLKTLITELEKSSSPPNHCDTPMINYGDFKKVGARCGDKYRPFFTAKVFSKLLQMDPHGRISLPDFSNYVTRKSCLEKSRIDLSLYDASGHGYLREQDLEAYIKDLIPRMPQINGIEQSFHSFYVCTALRKFFFFLDPLRTGKIKIRDILCCPFLDDFIELETGKLSKTDFETSWFSARSALRVYGDYLNLDRSRNGMLSKSELACYSKGTLTSAFVDRVFQECQTYDGDIDYKTYLDLVLALENRKEPQALQFFFRILDVNSCGYLDTFSLNYFYRDIQEQMKLHGQDPVGFEDVKDEIFDMVKPEQPCRITLRDLVRCGKGGTVVSILIDANEFWAYDNREALANEMIFYIVPPLLDVPLEDLQDICCKRVSLLLKIHKSEGNTEAIHEVLDYSAPLQDCLHEGTMHDIVSHFVVRSVLCTRPTMLHQIMQSEVMLFRYRFEMLTWDEKEVILRHVRNEAGSALQSKIDPEYRMVLQVLTDVLDAMFQDWNNISHNGDFEVRVPFESALSLVSSCSVVLERGTAIVTTPLLGELLTNLFEETFRQGMVHFGRCINFRRLFQDERMVHLGKLLQDMFKKNCKTPHGQLVEWRDVDTEAAWFPPCMLRDFRQLLSQHRLPHENRFCFSLFLKEAGLSLEQSLLFWKHHFSQEAGHTSNCSHTWQKNQSYIQYSLRHMYGMEGAKKDYTAHSCAQLQRKDCCPFTSKAIRMDPILQQSETLSAVDIEDIGQLCEDGRYIAACKCYMVQSSKIAPLQDKLDDTKADGVETSAVQFTKPSQYYFAFKHLVTEMKGADKCC